MLDLEFTWTCTNPECGHENDGDESDIDSTTYLYCAECNTPHVVKVSVEVSVDEVINAGEEEARQLAEREARHKIEVEISSDGGQTWRTEVIDTRNTDLATSSVKPGELVRLSPGSKQLPGWEKHVNTFWQTKLAQDGSVRLYPI